MFTGEEVRSITLDGSRGGDVLIAHDGTWLAGSLEGTDIGMWDAVTGRRRAVLPRADRLRAVAPDSTWLATSTEPDNSGVAPGLAQLWDAATGRLRMSLRGHDRPVYQVAIGPDGSWAATSSPDHSVKLWDVATGANRGTIKGHGHTVHTLAVAIAPDGTWLADLQEDLRAVRIWTVARKSGLFGPSIKTSRRAVLAGHSARVSGLVIAPRGAYVVTFSYDETARVWDPSTGRCRTVMYLGYKARRVDVGPDATWVAISGWSDHRLQVWDPATGTLRISVEANYSKYSMFPDGRFAIVAGDAITIWDPATNSVEEVPIGYSADDVIVSPDGTWFVTTGGYDAPLRIWRRSTS